jgi:hypothetical protein
MMVLIVEWVKVFFHREDDVGFSIATLQFEKSLEIPIGNRWVSNKCPYQNT